MLKQRILDTIRFFDLQDWPLTLLELDRFLIADLLELKKKLNSEFELVKFMEATYQHIGTDELLHCLETECLQEVGQWEGFYFLSGRKEVVVRRLKNYAHGILREKLIKKYIPLTRYLPFIRGVSVGGSQAMGQQKPTSDIDLLVFTETGRLWTARTFITFYLQIVGKRRHGKYVANRFCLNHYISGVGSLKFGHDLYNAMEYLRLRPVVNHFNVHEFQQHNVSWILEFFPNAVLSKLTPEKQNPVQNIFEWLLKNAFGNWLENKLMVWQLGKIRKGEFVVAQAEEISFHSKQRKFALLASFFEDQK